MQPNLLLVMSDDHAAHAISADSEASDRPVIDHTPNLDRIATQGMRFDSCFCTNSICTPSRASVLTGTYNHVNGVTTLVTPMDNTLDSYPQRLQAAGYQTALFGKWHLGHGPEHDPTGFDRWRVLPGQGHYHNPVMLQPRDDGRGHTIVERGGYVTDLITDDCLRWLDRRDPDRPFALMCHHKAPHRSWEPSRTHFSLYDGIDIPEPATLFDDHEGRADVVQAMRMRIMDLDPVAMPALHQALPAHDRLDRRQRRATPRLARRTGPHREHDRGVHLRPGLLPRRPTFLELAGVAVPTTMQGASLAPLLRGESPDGWQQSMYYRYWMHDDGIHRVPAHYGVRTHTHKLIGYYNDPLDQPGARGPAVEPEWELFDLVADPHELRNVIGDPAYRAVALELRDELARLQREVGDEPHPAATATLEALLDRTG